MIYHMLPRPAQLLIDILFLGLFFGLVWLITSNAIMSPDERAALTQLHQQVSAQHPELDCNIALLTRDGNVVTCSDVHGQLVIWRKP